jgi:hypothetical protein
VRGKTSDASFSLTPIEQVDGTKAIMIPTGPTSLVAVESRRQSGYDTGLPKSGALVYSVDTSIESGNGPIQVYPNNTDNYQSPLAVGQQVTVGKVTVSVVQSTIGSDTVRITVAP